MSRHNIRHRNDQPIPVAEQNKNETNHKVEHDKTRPKEKFIKCENTCFESVSKWSADNCKKIVRKCGTPLGGTSVELKKDAFFFKNHVL